MATRHGPPTVPSLPKIAQEIFEEYAAQANKGYTHALDWGAFYDFVIHCHQYGVRVSADEVKALLLARGFSLQAASDLANVYDHGRSLLQRRISCTRAMRAWQRGEHLAARESAQNPSLHRSPRTLRAESTESGDRADLVLAKSREGRRR
jgi:hypothetical protein